MTKAIGIYELTEVKAIAECAGDTEVQDALLIHEMKDEFCDGDCILYGYTLDDFDGEDEITDALISGAPESAFEINEDGIYHA